MRGRWLLPVALLTAAAAVPLAVLARRSALGPPSPAPDPPRLPDLLASPWPRPGQGPGEFTFPLPAGGGEVIALDERHRVTRRTADGRGLWTAQLDGPAGGADPPHLLADPDRVYVSHGDGVAALAVATGAPVWHTPGPGSQLFLSGDLLLAVARGGGGDGAARPPVVAARAAATGREVFRVTLPADRDGSDLLPIEEVAGLFLVQNSDRPGEGGLAVLLDRGGAEHHRLDRQVLAIREWAGGRLVLTGRDVVRLSSAGAAEWVVPLPGEGSWLAGGGFVPTPGGGMVAFRYCRSADSGVQVVRFDPARGGAAWAAACPGLGVSHSGYNHLASAEVERGALRVVSRGGAGVFVEVLDLVTGRSLRREQSRR